MEKDSIYKELRSVMRECCLGDIKQRLLKFEEVRKTYLKRFAIASAIVTGIALVIFLISIFIIFKVAGGFNLLFITASFAILLLISLNFLFKHFRELAKDYKAKVKDDLMPAFCKSLGEFSWEKGYYLNERNLKQVNLISPHYTHSRFDNIISGTRKSYKFEIIEAEFVSKRGNKASSLFDGVVIRIDMNKTFYGKTLIYPKGSHISSFGMDHNTASKLKYSKFEDTVFNKRFAVFTNDVLEAKDLLADGLMERMNNIKTAFQAKTIACSFYDNDLFIALSEDNDMFTVPDFTSPIADFKQFYTIIDEIISVIKLIDYFVDNQDFSL